MGSIGRTILYTLLVIVAVAVIIGAAMLIMGIVEDMPSDDTETLQDTGTADSGEESTAEDTTEPSRTPDAQTTTQDETQEDETTVPSETVVLDDANTPTEDGVTVTTYSSSITLYALYNVNARMSYSTSSDIYFLIYKGDSVTVTGETSNGWYQIKYGIYTAYIKQDLLTADASACEITITTYDTPKTMYTVEQVNVRDAPTTASNIYEMLSAGVEVTVLGETDNGWYYVVYGDGEAYINDDYLSTTMPETTDAETNEATEAAA